MKQLILSIFLITCVLDVSGQTDIRDIVTEKNNGAKVRILVSPDTIIYKEPNHPFPQIVFNVSLFIDNYRTPKAVGTWAFSFSIVDSKEIVVLKGSRLLVRLLNDEIMTLTTEGDKDKIGTYNSSLGSLYDVTMRYEITKAQLDKIIKFGIKKYKLERLNNPHEEEFETDILSKYISRSVAKIETRKKSKDSFLDGF